MTLTILRSALLGCIVALTSPALADDKMGDKTSDKTSDKTNDKSSSDAKTTKTSSAKKSSTMKTSDAPPSGGMATAEVMKTTQTALTHITAAETALDKGNSKAAKAALAKSEKALSKLYDTPPLDALMNEFDEAITGLTKDGAGFKPMDLEPLRASVTQFEAYVDPSVRAGVDEAGKKAESGDMAAAEEELRAARRRVSVDMAFLPVEEAYVRVLAAQRALDKGKKDQASDLLENVPIVVSRLQISQPLVPIRFKLHAAAEAVAAGKNDVAKRLLAQADREVQELEGVAKGTALEQELMPIADEIERINQQAIAGTQPKADQLRELARRTRDIGMEDDKG